MKRLAPQQSNNGFFAKIAGFFHKHRKALMVTGIILVALYWWDMSSGSMVTQFVFNKNPQLEEEKGRINILLLGIPGGNHDGPNLTDTIMVASYNLKNNKVHLISLPRDIWIDKYKVKVNALYQLGLNKGNGLGFAREEIGEILGMNIPYAVRVDFAGFVKAVDLVGGLDVQVERSFDDYQYPVAGKQNDLCGYKEVEEEVTEEKAKELGVKSGKLKILYTSDDKIATAAAEPKKDIVYTDEQVLTFFYCRFEHLSFKKGLAHLDGEMALKYVRSRHGSNNEGSDFARSKRQQIVLQSFKDKILSLDTLTDLSKINALLKTFGDSVETNVPQAKYLEFAKLARNIAGISSFVIDGNGDKPLLVSPPVEQYGAWVLVPAGGDYNNIHQFVENALSDIPPATESATVR